MTGTLGDDTPSEASILRGALTLRGDEILHDRRTGNGSRVQVIPVADVDDVWVERGLFNRDLALVPVLVETVFVALFALTASLPVVVFGTIMAAFSLALAFILRIARLRLQAGGDDIKVDLPSREVLAAEAFVDAVKAARDRDPRARMDEGPVPTARPFGM